MNIKHFVIAALISVALVTMALSPISSQQGDAYDPWTDYNEDGTINADDLNTFSQAFGSSGNPTKNVNVTNFPLDEQGNLRVALGEENIFPEVLVLRGTAVQVASTITTFTLESLLLDDHTPFPNVYPQAYLEGSYLNPPSSWQIRYNERFIYGNYPRQSYHIQGEVLVSLKYLLWRVGGTSHYEARGFLYLEKILTNGTIQILAETNMSEAIMDSSDSTIYTPAFIFTFESPIAVNQGERIAVRLRIDSRNIGTGGTFHFRHCICSNSTSNDFIVVIPIVP